MVCNSQHPFSIPPCGLEQHGQLSNQLVGGLISKIVYKLCASKERLVRRTVSEYAEKSHQGQLLSFRLFSLIAF